MWGTKNEKHVILDELQMTINKAEREGRNLTREEKRIAEAKLERVKEINEDLKLADEIDRIRYGFTSKAQGPEIPSLDFSGAQVKDMHTAAQNGLYFKASDDSAGAPMAAVGDYRLTPFPFLRDQARVASLIPVERTEAPTVFYFKGTTAASAAAARGRGRGEARILSGVDAGQRAGAEARALRQGQRRGVAGLHQL